MAKGGMHGEGVHGKGGGVWQRGGVAKGGMHDEGGICGMGHVWDTTRYRDTINEQAVRILLECILVYSL